MSRDLHDWLLEHLPPSLRALGLQQLTWFQWLGLPLLAACAAGQPSIFLPESCYDTKVKL